MSRESDSGVIFQIGLKPFDPFDRVIDEDKGRDLFIMDGEGVLLDESAIDELPPLSYYVAADDWPHAPVEKGDVVLFGGFPERYRERLTQSSLIQDTYSIAGVPVTGSYDDQFTCNLQRDTWELNSARANACIDERDWSGLSGSPVLCDRGAKGALRPELVGFIKAYNATIDQLVVTAASNIKPDGSIYHTFNSCPD